MASRERTHSWQIRVSPGQWEEVAGTPGFRRILSSAASECGAGPLFTVEDDGAEAPYAVISYSYWQRRFGGRPDVLGKTFTVRKVVMTVIGVTPRGFIGETAGQQPDVWLPLRMQPMVLPGDNWLHDAPPEKMMWLHVFGAAETRSHTGARGSPGNAIFKAGLQSFYGEVTSTHGGASCWISASRFGRVRAGLRRRAAISRLRSRRWLRLLVYCC